MNDDQISDAIDRLTDRAITAEANLLAIRQRIQRVRREAEEIESVEADNLRGMAIRLSKLYAYALEDIGLVAGIPEFATGQASWR